MAKFRNSLGSQLYNAQQIERYVDDQFFAFSRGNVLVATTNIGSGQSFTRTITYHPYSDGTSELNNRCSIKSSFWIIFINKNDSKADAIYMYNCAINLYYVFLL